EFPRAPLPEISFPWNLLGYPASANLGLLQATTITGVYGLSFLVAGVNALLAWAVASKKAPLRRRLAIAGVAGLALMVAMAGGPENLAGGERHTFARGVPAQFPPAPGKSNGRVWEEGAPRVA